MTIPLTISLPSSLFPCILWDRTMMKSDWITSSPWPLCVSVRGILERLSFHILKSDVTKLWKKACQKRRWWKLEFIRSKFGNTKKVFWGRLKLSFYYYMHESYESEAASLLRWRISMVFIETKSMTIFS